MSPSSDRTDGQRVPRVRGLVLKKVGMRDRQAGP